MKISTWFQDSNGTVICFKGFVFMVNFEENSDILMSKLCCLLEILGGVVGLRTDRKVHLTNFYFSEWFEGQPQILGKGLMFTWVRNYRLFVKGKCILLKAYF